MLSLRLSRRLLHQNCRGSIKWHGFACLSWHTRPSPTGISLIPRAPVPSLTRYSPSAPYGRIRLNSIVAKPSTRLDEDGLPLDIDNDEAKKVIERAKQVWPCPSVIPAGWSCAWENWPYLLTFFWFSPYFLMLPQIEMLVNIRYKIPGEARPILYSDERESFIFVVNGKFCLYDCRNLEMYRFEGGWTEESFVHAMCGDFDAIPRTKLEEDPEGAKVLQRILDRDETVTQVLRDKYLNYTPDVTEIWQENQIVGMGRPELTEEEAEKELERLVDKMEKKIGPES